MGRRKVEFTPWTILQILRSHHRGASVASLARKHGLDVATIYRWQQKYGHEAKLGFLEHCPRELDKLHEIVLGLQETLGATVEQIEALKRRVGVTNPPPPPKMLPMAESA